MPPLSVSAQPVDALVAAPSTRAYCGGLVAAADARWAWAHGTEGALEGLEHSVGLAEVLSYLEDRAAAQRPLWTQLVEAARRTLTGRDGGPPPLESYSTATLTGLFRDVGLLTRIAQRSGAGMAPHRDQLAPECGRDWSPSFVLMWRGTPGALAALAQQLRLSDRAIL